MESCNEKKLHMHVALGLDPQSKDCPILVIPPEAMKEDIEYWTKHALICKFLGVCISLSALET